MYSKIIEKRYLEYNTIIKENDDLYRCAVKALGVPECAFWILYALQVEQAALTQSQICSYLYQPKQTVNSALKKLEMEGYIDLKCGEDRRSKQITLTEKGTELAGSTVDKLIAVEQDALQGLTEEEQIAFIGLFRKYTYSLKEKMKKL